MAFVLGLTLGHNATAALSQDGAIVACASEERFVRKKNVYGYPEKAIAFCLKEAGISAEKLDLVVLASHITPPLIVTSDGTMEEEHASRPGFSWFGVGSSIRKVLQNVKPVEERLYHAIAPLAGKLTHEKRKTMVAEKLGISGEKIISSEHHLTHALSAIYASGFKPPFTVVTVDGEGDGVSSTVGIFDGRYRRIAASSFADSLGHLYSAITVFLGMRMLEDEYKVMGMAPYAETEKSQRVASVLRGLLRVEGLQFRSSVHSHAYLPFLKKKLDGFRFDAIAGGCQQITEELLLQFVKHAIEATHNNRVVLAGGVFMNVKANQLIAELPEVEEMHVIPSCGDESLPIGACYYGHDYLSGIFHELDHTSPSGSQGVTVNKPFHHVYFGPAFTQEDIQSALDSSSFKYKYYGDRIAAIVGRLLADNEIVARCDGRMEFGARALGNRSLLANAADLQNMERLNRLIKKRDFWMPFAPSILEEWVPVYVKDSDVLKKTDPRYMMFTFHATPRAAVDLAASLHPYDKTMRAHVVTDSQNPGYYRVLQNYAKLTDRGGILNTSFNIHGEPIVCSPDDALHTMKNSGLNYLALGEFLVYK